MLDCPDPVETLYRSCCGQWQYGKGPSYNMLNIIGAAAAVVAGGNLAVSKHCPEHAVLVSFLHLHRG